MDDLFNYFNPATQAVSPMISTETHDVITKNAHRLNSAIIYDRDYAYNYFGFKVCFAICNMCDISLMKIIPENVSRV